MKRGLSKYSLLNNEQWLLKKYCEEKLTTYDIKQLTGASHDTVGNALKRFKIPIRSQYKRNILNREDDCFVLNLSVIEGGLLGDATLRCRDNYSLIANPYFKRCNKFLDHVEWVANQCFHTDSFARIKFNHRYDARIKKYTDSWCFESLTHKELRPIFDRWYPENNNRVKLVPKDFVLDTTSLLHWFLDDGSCSIRPRKFVNSYRLSFCTWFFL